MPQYDDSCIFCKIAAGEFNTEFVVETENVVAFADINPVAPTHVLVIPREHIASAHEVSADQGALWQEMLQVAQQVAEKVGIAESGYRLVTNIGPDGGQEVFHLHLHVLGGDKLGGITTRKK